jgi:hypothetical protein
MYGKKMSDGKGHGEKGEGWEPVLDFSPGVGRGALKERGRTNLEEEEKKRAANLN